MLYNKNVFLFYFLKDYVQIKSQSQEGSEIGFGLLFMHSRHITYILKFARHQGEKKS